MATDNTPPRSGPATVTTTADLVDALPLDLVRFVTDTPEGAVLDLFTIARPHPFLGQVVTQVDASTVRGMRWRVLVEVAQLVSWGYSDLTVEAPNGDLFYLGNTAEQG